MTIHLDLSHLINASGSLDIDELRQLIEFARTRKCSEAARLTGHDPETVARSWDRFGKHLAKALSNALPTENASPLSRPASATIVKPPVFPVENGSRLLPGKRETVSAYKVSSDRPRFVEDVRLP